MPLLPELFFWCNFFSNVDSFVALTLQLSEMCCFNTTHDKLLHTLVCISDGYNNQDTFCHFEVLPLFIIRNSVCLVCYKYTHNIYLYNIGQLCGGY